jgi:hypothetical protein
MLDVLVDIIIIAISLGEMILLSMTQKFLIHIDHTDLGHVL